VYLVPFSSYSELIICRKWPILLHPTCICRPCRGWPHSNFAVIFDIRKLESLRYRVALFAWSYTFSRFDTILEYDRQRDRQTHDDGIYRDSIIASRGRKKGVRIPWRCEVLWTERQLLLSLKIWDSCVGHLQLTPFCRTAKALCSVSKHVTMSHIHHTIPLYILYTIVHNLSVLRDNITTTSAGACRDSATCDPLDAEIIASAKCHIFPHPGSRKLWSWTTSARG